MRLSIVVPAHDVARYLRDCLASILSSSEDLDVVVVDDGSRDTTAEIARERAGEDPRVRLVTNRQAIGPGGARNRGLAEATGDYVWFVDGDDWLLDDAVSRAVGTLRDGVPDVVLMDHVRAYPSGRLAVSTSRPVLLGAPTEPFTLASWPDAVKVLHTPWNKLLRRELLERHGLRFSSSPVYEDVSFTYRALQVASAITVITTPTYAYRTARPGALTRTSSADHLAWLDEWSVVLEAARDQPPDVRRALFERMLWHGWSVIGLRNGRRIPRQLRGEFLAGFTGLYHSFRLPHTASDRVLELGWRPVAEARVVAQWVGWAAGRVGARVSRRAS